jgi:hypothetical protein
MTLSIEKLCDEKRCNKPWTVQQYAEIGDFIVTVCTCAEHAEKVRDLK